MYGKLFVSMYEGTLYGNWKALVTFQQMIILCDREGFIDMTPQAIAARTSIPLDIIREGIAALEQPDQYSRSPALDGRRIERIDGHRPWGWRIVNYVKYRTLVATEEKRQADRERIASKRAAERDPTRQDATTCAESPNCRDVSQIVENVAQAEVDADADALSVSRPPGGTATVSKSFHWEVIAAYHELLPDLPPVKVWSKKRRQSLDARIRERCQDGKPADTIEYWRDFFERVAVSDFLCGKKTTFVASLEWVLRPENFLKIIEGNYDNRSRGNGVGAHG